MARSFALVLIPALVTTIAHAAPVPKGRPPVEAYFPAQVGAKWVYTMNGREIVEIATAVEMRDGAKRVTVDGQDMATKRPTQREVLSVSEKGLFRVYLNHLTNQNELLCLLRLPDKPDQVCRWEGTDRSFLPQVAHGDYTAHEGERVQVPAGEYRAVRVELKYTTGQVTRKATYWYAPNVGLVKMVSGGTVKELKSFTPVKD